ncbi:MAG: hypothetical protein SV186_01990 [Candidatus Nanohaloarchaea archaeon]|nr:hypothetical protein [Candidatus Nanohaloarchaea archaeon]
MDEYDTTEPDREAFFDTLEYVITGDPNETSRTVAKYRGLDTEEALDQAEDYLADARESQRNASSDHAYWMYAGDVAVGEALTSYLEAEQADLDEIPALPDPDGVLMDKHAALHDWADEVEDLVEQYGEV